MTDAGQSPGVGPLVCPFVALAEDRDRRADAPDERHRCYAEKAPRRRDLVYQADYCYTARFSSCTAFLAWAARNAAEPTYVTEAAQRAWASGIASPEDGLVIAAAAADGSSVTHPEHPQDGRAGLPAPIPAIGPEGGRFGPTDPAEPGTGRAFSEQLDWVSASAWADAPWDPTAETEAEASETLATEPLDDEEPGPVEGDAAAEEALQGPKVPAALPMRRRRQPQQPIRTRGSGEWYYADPLDHEPLVRRRVGVAPPILLAVLGLLVVSLVVFMLPTLLGGGRDDQTAAVASPPAGQSPRPIATRAPFSTAEASAPPSPTPEPQIRTYIVKPGDTLSAIAAKRAVPMRLLQCINVLTNPNLLQPGQELLIPPDGYSCPAGWRRGATPSPEASTAP